ncbi:MAG: DUF4229 domain-containing protein [Nocardioidaceae bacterium]|nr:MAG: DUF4229 domain-containing protein [Nocardioidaceae bacterium]
MREFAIYTGLRLALFVAAFAVVFGLWLLIADEAALLWPLLIAMLISGVASVYLLRAPRERFAQRIEERAQRAAAKFEEHRAKEDFDE